MSGLVLAVDGGNAKTDLALVATDGRVHAFVRGPGSSPHEHGVDGALDCIEALLIEAGADGPVAHAELLLAGVDFPSEVETVQTRARERGLEFLTLGLSAQDEQTRRLRRYFRCREYRSRLYRVSWPGDGDNLQLDRRPVLPEVALL